MPSAQSSGQRLDLVRELIREKGLSRQDLQLLEEILRVGGGDVFPLLETGTGEAFPVGESLHLAKLRRAFGLFLAFLNQFSERRLGEVRPAMGLVLQHSLDTLGELAATAHREVLDQNLEPDWVIHLLDLIASLRTMATSLGSGEGSQLKEHWTAYLQEERDHIKSIFAVLAGMEEGPALVARLNQLMKTLNRALQSGSGNPLEPIRKMEALLGGALPESTRLRAEPLLLVQHVIASLRIMLFRPLDRGVHWPAVEHIRGSLQWLWNHLGWSLPRVEDRLLEKSLPGDVRALLKQLRENHPPSFRIVARALVSHLALLSLVEGMEPAVNASIPKRFASVPHFYVIESELGRLAERVFHPRAADNLPKGSEESLLLGAFLRQAVLSLLQDQATIRGLLLQTLTNDDVDQLAITLDNLRALLLSHQRQLMGDLVGLFSPELRHKLFPDSPSLTEEGDRLRRRLHRLWQYMDPALGQIRLHLELRSWPRLALALSQAQGQVASFRRSPEFLLIRSVDRQEFERLTLQFTRSLEDPAVIETSLEEASETVGEILRFLDQFLLRINARVPLIRLDLTTSREALRLGQALRLARGDAPDRSRLTHKLIQTTKPLGVRDPQALNLLKRWVRAERSGREVKTHLDALLSHLEHLSSRLDAALS
ncbi:hypothetical protein METEAL_03580 [Mesoterricola silvestris]|uniref:Uncharacterized protein n=1 Tax=Mesoterricola silvestris TaxID=2927979 RepID=A0AA48GHQ4_9BACT|nr:hypothetical protein METEAL_03580 [Mesoterricola silvestris]